MFFLIFSAWNMLCNFLSCSFHRSTPAATFFSTDLPVAPSSANALLIPFIINIIYSLWRPLSVNLKQLSWLSQCRTVGMGKWSCWNSPSAISFIICICWFFPSVKNVSHDSVSVTRIISNKFCCRVTQLKPAPLVYIVHANHQIRVYANLTQIPFVPPALPSIQSELLPQLQLVWSYFSMLLLLDIYIYIGNGLK